MRNWTCPFAARPRWKQRFFCTSSSWADDCIFLPSNCTGCTWEITRAREKSYVYKNLLYFYFWKVFIRRMKFLFLCEFIFSDVFSFFFNFFFFMISEGEKNTIKRLSTTAHTNHSCYMHRDASQSLVLSSTHRGSWIIQIIFTGQFLIYCGHRAHVHDE